MSEHRQKTEPDQHPFQAGSVACNRVKTLNNKYI
jgi:hypothetical protein